MPNKFQTLLKKQTILIAEGYIFELERRGHVQAGPFVPEVVLDRPQAVIELTEEFARAGSDVVLALTYYAHRSKLEAVGRDTELEKLNRQALQIARKVADKHGLLMAGNISNTWVWDKSKPKKSLKKIKNIFDEQVVWAKQEGADVILGETFSVLAEAQAALEIIHKHKLPAIINLAPSKADLKTLDGINIITACQKLADQGAEVVGLNCMIGPDSMLPLLKKLVKEVKTPIAAIPVPYNTTAASPTFHALKDHHGHTAFPSNLDLHLSSRQQMAEFTTKAQKLGVKVIGGCCGAGPHHIRAMAEALGRTTPASKFSPDLSNHPLFGKTKELPKGYEDRFMQKN